LEAKRKSRSIGRKKLILLNNIFYYAKNNFYIIHYSLFINHCRRSGHKQHKIDSILNLVSLQSISRMDRELSGDTIVTIGGVPQILFSRFWTSIGNVRASQYIFEKISKLWAFS